MASPTKGNIFPLFGHKTYFYSFKFLIEIIFTKIILSFHLPIPIMEIRNRVYLKKYIIQNKINKVFMYFYGNIFFIILILIM